jgi:hypothetical protein
MNQMLAALHFRWRIDECLACLNQSIQLNRFISIDKPLIKPLRQNFTFRPLTVHC